MTVVVDQDEEEAATVAAAQADPARFAVLYRSHVHLVHAFAWSRLHDRAGAEDVTAETFRRALRALPRYEPRGVPFRAWLLRICANLVMDEHARRARADRLAEVVPRPSDPADLTAAVDERARLHALVAQLPADRRAVLVLRFAEDLRIADVAARLGRTPDAVKQLQRRALADLRALLAAEELDHAD